MYWPLTVLPLSYGNWRTGAASGQSDMKTPLPTDQLGNGYPRPQLERSQWHSLNGPWQFRLDPKDQARHPRQVLFDREIIVPYAPETKCSGINDGGFYKSVWYRKEFETPAMKSGERLILHFGAVDWQASVWVNGSLVVEHEGGYTPFSADITEHLHRQGKQSIEVRAQDNPHDLEKNRGKQDWQEQPHGIWYPRTTGIWQTVWMEVVPDTHLTAIDWHPNAHQWTIGFTAQWAGSALERAYIAIKLECHGRILADNAYSLTEAESHNGAVTRTVDLVELQQRLELPDGALDDISNQLLWHPDRPNIIEALVELRTSDGTVLDRCHSYTQLRTVQTSPTQLIVNGRPEFLRLALDQGYWQNSGMTPPNDEAIKQDITLLKLAGFNGVRKHNKLEDPRFLYWADVLGLFVWEELPSAYRFTEKAMERSYRLWMESIRRDRNHGCIIAWVPINESWGVPSLPSDERQRQFVHSLYRLTKVLTGGGIVIGNDGWEMVESDVVAIHDYDADCHRLARRYAPDTESVRRLFADERPGGRVLLLQGMTHEDKPKMLTEFGGIKLSAEEGSWGYSVATSAEDLARRYTELLNTVKRLPLLGGFCYTEFTDVYQEANGLFFMDRTPKFPIEVMRAANSRD